MEHGTSSAGPSTCDDPPDSSLTSPFLNAASPILCAPLQDTTLPLARASHVWLPAEEQWRQLKPLMKRKQAVGRPASGMAGGADAAGVPVSRRGPVADALPPGLEEDNVRGSRTFLMNFVLNLINILIRKLIKFSKLLRST